MSKFHIAKDGKPQPCNPKKTGVCGLGSEIPHGTQKEMEALSEKNLEDNHTLINTLSKSNSKVSDSSYPDANSVMLQSRISAAEDLNTTEEDIAKLAGDLDPTVRYFVSINPNTSQDILRKLSGDFDSFVREGVASNSNTDHEIVELLVEDKNEQVRVNIASRLDLQEHILDKLSEDKSPYVRSYAVSNPNMSSSNLYRLAEDAHSNVQASVMSNPNTPEDAIEKILGI